MLKFTQISNITDNYHLGHKASLETFAPLLKTPSQNHHATLLGFFTNAISDTYKELKIPPPPHDKKLLAQYTNFNLEPWLYPADREKRMRAENLMRDYGAVWAKYEKRWKLRDAERRAGVRMKRENTLVDAWPFRVRPGMTRKEFEILLASEGTVGHEKYVEWQRT